MYRLMITALCISYSSLTLAEARYQIDLILFAQPHNANRTIDANFPLIPTNSPHARTLTKNAETDTLYTLLPSSQSGLSNEYYLLSRKSPYQVLAHYSWKQSAKKQEQIALPKETHHGWLIQGTIHVQQGAYYTLNAQLQCSPPSQPQMAFTVTQKQRLKENTVYYLDHAQIGMLVKIHKMK